MFEPSTLAKRIFWTPARLLMIGEAALFTFAVSLVVALQPLSENGEEGEVVVSGLAQWSIALGLIYAVFMLAVMHALGMHVIRSRKTFLQTTMKYVYGISIGSAALWILVHSVPDSGVEPSIVFGVTALVFAVLIAWRVTVSMILDSSAARRNVLVIGSGDKAAAFQAALRRRSDRRGLEIIGFIPTDDMRTSALDQGQLLHIRTSIARVCERSDIDEIIVASDRDDNAVPLEDLLDCRFQGVRVTDAATFIERECGRIPIELVAPDWWLYSGGFVAGMFRRFSQRAFDLILGGIILVLATPMMLACALAIKLGEGWKATVFYRQERVGKGGKPFRLVKFRSMREDAEKDGIARWAKADDDRITRVGSVLRKTRLDELPQLLNVIRGDMSLVGPRPERPEFVRTLAQEIPYYNRRHAVRPGITGWAQLCYPYGASTRDAQEKLKFDLYYIKNANIILDFAILLRTVEVVLFGKGAR